MPLFRKVLIANRGEIAVRIIRTCRAMGIPTVAVFSEADRSARHVVEADEGFAIGPAEALRSYLSIDALIDAARRSGAEAVHPGYGFLSQSADFADAVRDAGLVFVGPPGDVHRRMGDKGEARRLMASVGVPVLPGYDGDDQSDARLLAEAKAVGWPVMLKPSRGGGREGDAGSCAGRRTSSQRSPPHVASRKPLSTTTRWSSNGVSTDRVTSRSRSSPTGGERSCTSGSASARSSVGIRRSSKRRQARPFLPTGVRPLRGRCRGCSSGGLRQRGDVEFLLAPDGTFSFLEMNTRCRWSTR